MDLQLKDQTVLVVGASEGIGLAAARLFVAEGARVMIASRDNNKLKAAAQTLAADTGQTVPYFAADIRDPVQVQSLYDWVSAQSQQLDVLVSAVGGSYRSQFEELTDADWMASYEFNLLGNVRLIRAFHGLLKAAENASIVTLGAAAARMPYPNQVVSNVHKAGMLSLVKTLAIEFASDQIRVNSVCPGRTLTSLWTNRADKMAAEQGSNRDAIIAEYAQEIPMQRFGQAEESAALVVFLASPRASYITGQSINVDGGIARSLL